MREWLVKELVMPKKRFGDEQIVTLLRQIEVSMAQGKPALIGLCRKLTSASSTGPPQSELFP